MLYVKKLTETAQLPTLGSNGAAGFDLYADETVTIPEFSRMVVSTGIAVSIDPGKVGMIWPRSGLAVKGISTDAGVIDSDYRGAVGVVITNMTKHRYTVNLGDRIAQLLIQPAFQEMIEERDELHGTERGANACWSAASWASRNTDAHWTATTLLSGNGCIIYKMNCSMRRFMRSA